MSAKMSPEEEIARLQQRLLEADIARRVALLQSGRQYREPGVREDGCHHDLDRQWFGGVVLPCAEPDCVAGASFPDDLLHVAGTTEMSFVSWSQGGKIETITNPQLVVFQRTRVVYLTFDSSTRHTWRRIR